MKKPTIEEIQAYIDEKNLNIDAEGFFYHYQAKGWKTKSGPMVCWHSAVALWGVQGWGKTGRSTARHAKRSARPDDARRARELYQDHFEQLTPRALQDKIDEPGQMKHVVWLMEEVKAEIKNMENGGWF